MSVVGDGVILHHPAMSAEAIQARPGEEIVEYLRDIHVNTNGWKDIGYTFVFNLDKDGNWRLYDGRPTNQYGTHAPGYNDWIGICVCIDWPEGRLVDKEMYQALAKSIKDLSEEFDISLNSNTVLGHNDVYATACPGKLNVGRVLNAISGLIARKATDKPDLSQFDTMTVQLPSNSIEGLNIEGRTFIRITELNKLGFSVSYEAENNQNIVKRN